MANRRHFETKIEKSPYLSNGLTYRDQFWYDDACRPS